MSLLSFLWTQNILGGDPTITLVGIFIKRKKHDWIYSMVQTHHTLQNQHSIFISYKNPFRILQYDKWTIRLLFFHFLIFVLWTIFLVSMLWQPPSWTIEIFNFLLLNKTDDNQKQLSQGKKCGNDKSMEVLPKDKYNL